MLEIISERKSYEEKVQILKIRIKKLQEQENDINKLAKKVKEKFENEQKLKSEKKEQKGLVLSSKELTEKMIILKKKEIENLRIKRKEAKDKAINDHLIKNKVSWIIILESISNCKK